MTALRRSFLLSAADRYANQILVIATTAIMARILTPAETGLYLIANTIIMLADNLRSFGIGPYIVQEQNLSRKSVRSAFTLTLIVSGAMYLVILLADDALARFYGNPDLAELLRIAALGFLMMPFAGPVVALMQRDLAFGKLAVVNVAAIVAGSSVTIGLGMAGAGAASYVWGYVVAGSVTAILAFAMRPELWIFRPALSEVRRFVAFGSISSTVMAVNLVSDMLPRLAFGKLLGFDAVGLYARAMTICQLPDRAIVQAMQPVILPAMAARSREGGDLRQIYLRGHAMMSAFQWPALAVLALLAGPAVQALLGEQWGEAAPLLRVMALAMMALAPAFLTYPLLVAKGRIRDTLTASLISLPPTVAIALAAANFGLMAVAASMLVTAPFQMLVSLFFVRRAIGLTWQDLIAASRSSLALTAGAALVPSVVLLTFSTDGLSLAWGPTALSVAGAAGGWVATIFLSRHPIGPEIAGIWRMLGSIAAR